MRCRERQEAIAAPEDQSVRQRMHKLPGAQREAEGEHTVLVAYSLESKLGLLYVGRINGNVERLVFQINGHESVVPSHET